MQDELARCREDFDAFVYSASHDLREALRGLRHYAGFLQEDYAAALGEEGAKRLQAMTSLVRRMERQLDALGELARISGAPLTREASRLNDLVADVLRDQDTPIAASGATIEVDALPTLKCSAGWVRTLFACLLANAVTYNDQVSKQVIVGQDGRDAHGHVVLFVGDNGIGVDERHREEVFTLFRRLHGRDAYGGGIGAGLTLARKIVERHGGRIWVTPAPAGGCVFCFTLGV